MTEAPLLTPDSAVQYGPTIMDEGLLLKSSTGTIVLYNRSLEQLVHLLRENASGTHLRKSKFWMLYGDEDDPTNPTHYVNQTPSGGLQITDAFDQDTLCLSAPEVAEFLQLVREHLGLLEPVDHPASDQTTTPEELKMSESDIQRIEAAIEILRLRGDSDCIAALRKEAERLVGRAVLVENSGIKL